MFKDYEQRSRYEGYFGAYWEQPALKKKRLQVIKASYCSTTNDTQHMAAKKSRPDKPASNVTTGLSASQRRPSASKPITRKDGDHGSSQGETSSSKWTSARTAGLDSLKEIMKSMAVNPPQQPKTTPVPDVVHGVTNQPAGPRRFDSVSRDDEPPQLGQISSPELGESSQQASDGFQEVKRQNTT